ncbi:MAG: MOSC domain-containing protein [Lachnospiraceae bacterium]|nr:MOSC domain-containing protein [Lachnospiraceae bacterium]
MRVFARKERWYRSEDDGVNTGKIAAVCISEKKGTVKKDVGECRIREDHGLETDAHAGSGRQVSLLSLDRVREFEERSKMKIEAGAFGENLLVEGLDLRTCPIGARLRCGEALLEITQIGKECHLGCEIRTRTGDCIMPREGVFARVLEGGMVRTDDMVKREYLPFRAAVITASDRAYRGTYEDESGPLVATLLEQNGYQVTETIVLPDEEELLYQELVRIADQESPDIILTTGGTGFSVRDRMPEASLRAAERNAPGVAEAIRAHSMQITPRAMLSRAVSVIRGTTLIVNLPGSPKAVRECLDYLLPNLEHGLRILRGEADG